MFPVVVIPVAAHHMTNTGIVAVLEAHAIIVAKLTGHIRVAIFIAVIYIRRTMVLVVLASPFDAIMKTTPLSVGELRRTLSHPP